MTAHAIDKERFGLYLVMTNPVAGYERTMAAAIEAGVRYVQLRHKPAPPQEVRPIARALRRMALGTKTRFILNDDVDLAIECDADGLHLGQDDTPVAEAKKRWAAARVFGLSTHNEAQARAAEGQQPNYIGVGPVFATPTKAVADPVLGLERAAAIVRASNLTTVAIGGIDAQNLPAVLARGIDNFAVVRFVCESAQPQERIGLLQAIANEAFAARPKQA